MAPNQHDALIQSHEGRIKDVEDEVGGLSRRVEPVLGGIVVTMRGLEVSLTEIKSGIKDLLNSHEQLGGRVRDLENFNAGLKARHQALSKVLLGVASAGAIALGGWAVKLIATIAASH